METKINFFNELERSGDRGFSLIEILIALTLLAIAGTFVAGRIFVSLERGKITATKIQMDSLADRLKEFRRDCGRYPTTEQGMQALVEKPATCKKWRPGGYLEDETIPLDPWEEHFSYESDGRKFNITSFGPDKEEGGVEMDADIHYRK